MALSVNISASLYVRFGIVGRVGRYPKTSVFDELVIRLRNPLSFKLDLLTMKTTTPIIPHFFMKSSTPSFVLVVLTQRPPGGINDILCVLNGGRLCLMSYEPNFSKRERKIVRSVALNYGCNKQLYPQMISLDP